MREIKFRGISKCMFADGWVYGHYHVAEDDTPIIDDCKIDKATVGQFTGLHDRNGKEIYEGDVVRWRSLGIEQNVEISFRKGAFVILANDGCHSLALRETDKENIEVIGNIYEDSHLIKG